MTDKNKIFDRLRSDYEHVQSLGYEVVGVFLQGSQNYHLDYEGSDIDTKVIVLPTFEDFVLRKKPVSTTLILPSNEHIDLKDIRLMFECFLKQNINFLEILFTEYKIINPKYEDLYKPMFENRERIAHFNNYAAVNCIAGLAAEKFHALEHPYPSLIEKITKHGYDNKQLHHLFRCLDFLVRYTDGVSYEKCLIPLTPEFLTEVKAKYVYDLDEARVRAKITLDLIQNIKKDYLDKHEVKIDNGAKEIVNNVMLNILKAFFKEQVLEEDNG